MIFVVLGCAIAVGVLVSRSLRDARDRRDRPKHLARVYGLAE